jgi:hypothetical protein
MGDLHTENDLESLGLVYTGADQRVETEHGKEYAIWKRDKELYLFERIDGTLKLHKRFRSRYRKRDR